MAAKRDGRVPVYRRCHPGVGIGQRIANDVRRRERDAIEIAAAIAVLVPPFQARGPCMR